MSVLSLTLRDREAAGGASKQPSDAAEMSSRLPGLHALSPEDRQRTVVRAAGDDDRVRGLARALDSACTLPLAVADRMSENVVGVHGLPFSVATNFLVNGRQLLIPMSIEEPSVVAAASHAAKMVRGCGGFVGEADPAVMTAQVLLDAVPNPAGCAAVVDAHRASLMGAADRAMTRMVSRGGGCRDIEVRVLDADEGMVAVHFFIDVVDAMGANVVDSVAEAVAPALGALLGGEVILRILSNLPLRRMVRVRARLDEQTVGGAELAHRIARASAFADKDLFRAVTHNKGIMNGIDAVAVALGQDWRAIEAGAHAYAGRGQGYAPLARWEHRDGHLVGSLQMPLAVATVGGSLGVHPGARAALELTGATRASEVSVLMAAAGLACNFAALRALAGEGIQRGHMRLHARKRRSDFRCDDSTELER